MGRCILIWYWSASGGGGSQFAVRLAQRLARQFGDDAVRLSLHADDPCMAQAAAFAFETLAAPVVTGRSLPIKTAANLAASARVLAEHARGVDCVIVPMNFAAATPLSLSLRQPLVYVAHDPAPHPGDYARGWQRLTQAALLGRSARVVALSDFSARLLKRSSSVAAKLHVAPLGAVFEPRPLTPRGDGGPVRLLCVGRMIAYKGLDLLARALPVIAARDDWRLTVAGEGPALAGAMQARLRGLHVEVRRGWLSEGELGGLIGGCDVLLAPYSSATQSGVVAQALALGRPCVVTPVGALPEQIGEGAAGWIAAAPEPEALGDALRLAIDDSEGRDERARGAARLARAAWRADCWSWIEAL